MSRSIKLTSELDCVTSSRACQTEVIHDNDKILGKNSALT